MIAAVVFGVLSVVYWTYMGLRAMAYPGLDWHAEFIAAAVLNALWGVTASVMSVVEKK